MRRIGCDIYGYPVYEPEGRLFTVSAENGCPCMKVVAKDAQDAARIFGELIELTQNGGVYIREVH